jgi:hypothetical protein
MNVLLQIISHRWFVGNDPHPSKDAIAERMGKHPRTVQAYLSSLERKGFLRRAQWYKPHKARTRTATISPVAVTPGVTPKLPWILAGQKKSLILLVQLGGFEPPTS